MVRRAYDRSFNAISMVNFIEFPVFDGVSRDLRQWIAWLEDFFVRERFTGDEKMNLAQSLLEGEANAWFYSSRKHFSFQSWEHLVVELLIWRFGDFGDGGVFSDLELFLLWNKYDRIVRKRRKRMETTSITPQESISSPATIPETIPVDKFSNQQVDEISAEKKESKQEVDLSMEKIASQLKLPNTKVHVSDSENLRNIETRIKNSVLDNFESVVKEAKIQTNIRMDVVNGDVERIQRVMSITKNISAYQVFDKTSAHKERLKPKSKRKLSLSLKTWKFKFKNKNLQHWSQMDLHQVIDSSTVNNLSPCVSANFGLVRKHRTLQCLRLKKQAHKSRVQYHLRRLHDPGGKKDEHYDEIFETEVDIGKVQRPQMDTVAESVITATDNVASSSNAVAPSTDVITERQRWDEACDSEIDALEGTGTYIVTSLPANKIPIGCTWVSLAVHALFLHQISWLLQRILDDLKSHVKHKWKSKHLQAVFDLQNILKRFAEGEIYVQLQESVRGCDVFLVKPTCPPANENLMELLVMIDTCLRASGNTFTAVIPYFGYARADRTTHGCEYIAAYHEWHRWKHKTAFLQGLLAFVVFTLVNFYSNGTAVSSLSQSLGLAQHGGEEIMGMLLFWSTSFKKQRFGKNWWYKFKHSLWQGECGKELLEVEVVVAETVVDVSFDDVGRSEPLIKWQDHDASEYLWMFSKAFVQLYPSYKLEDKLGLEGVSIDTIHHRNIGRRSRPAHQELVVGRADVAETSKEKGKTLFQSEALPFSFGISYKKKS